MMKRMTFVCLAMLLVFPFQVANANVNGVVGSKDEVVYGSLSATGTLNELYVVNMLDVAEQGFIIDYGDYTAVRNLTDLSVLEQDEDEVQLEASPGWFYYQGNMENHELPWNINISYMLDGEEVFPDELAGKEGRLLLTIKTSNNEQVDPSFFENYTLQISLTLDTEKMSNIQAPDANIANVGKKRQLTYTVMPDSEGDVSFLADVTNFEMEGIDIAAIPLSMALDNLETEEMTSEMRTLSDAIQEINNGVSDLNTGVSELNDGVQSLNRGSRQYGDGMIEIKDASAEIISASRTIDESLAMLYKGLSGSSNKMDLSGLAQLPEGLSLMADGLKEVANGLTQLNENYPIAFSALNEAMNGIPASGVSEEDIQQLYESGANPETIEHLVDVLVAAQTAKGTYDNVKEAFVAVGPALEGTNGAVHEMSNQLRTLASELSGAFESMEGLDALSELEEGIGLLAKNYGQFHAGLVSYTDGVAQLANSYSEIASGFGEVAKGTSELSSGVGELRDGTAELARETSDLPEQMQEEIDAMREQFDKSDFEPVSFVSPKNMNVESVQFILKTEPIELDEEEETTFVEEEGEVSFWERLRSLFLESKKV
ncbi:YhgE/Pip domain-containing protein [Alkalihalobacillus sp. MEB130]|uniref:YhgE/Pip domain-containing protein n=1 Tax=Alkalihalobacillus sp. MEB130 TaxID=2976704 RepID=UPI0028DDDD94|nr:YhgE/Pip domain-containing protein [Alkalihalobacillus sp. MEB130]MDT8860250.1 YhgE/Pip domain-containing protein [Alkalihalobacillus sp. MEB130]